VNRYFGFAKLTRSRQFPKEIAGKQNQCSPKKKERLARCTRSDKKTQAKIAKISYW